MSAFLLRAACLLCGADNLPAPQGQASLVIYQEHAMQQHGVSQDDLARPARREDGAGGFVYALPDGRDWLAARRGAKSISAARDILVFRGAEYWPTPEDVVREVHAQGLSVRIPRHNVPAGLVRGLSRIALAHIKAVMVVEQGTEDALRAAFEALHDPEVDKALARTYEHKPSRWLEMPESKAKQEIFKRFGVKFSPGIFAYCYWTGTSYYVKPGEEAAPDDLAAKGLKAVRGLAAETGEALACAEADDERDE